MTPYGCWMLRSVLGMVLHPTAVGRSENPGVPVLFCGHNMPPLVEIGLTDLPKSAMALPGTTGLTNLPIKDTLYLLCELVFRSHLRKPGYNQVSSSSNKSSYNYSNPMDYCSSNSSPFWSRKAVKAVTTSLWLVFLNFAKKIEKLLYLFWFCFSEVSN